jgi:hypothetical protein
MSRYVLTARAQEDLKRIRDANAIHQMEERPMTTFHHRISFPRRRGARVSCWCPMITARVAFALVTLATLALGTARAQTVLGGSCDLAAVGATTTPGFLEFDREIKHAAESGDSFEMAALVRYPLRVNSSLGTISLDEPRALQNRFRETFTPAILRDIKRQLVEDTFCSSEGVTFGAGRVWVGFEHGRFAIQVINVPDDPLRVPVKQPIEFACNADHHRIVIDSVSDNLRYRSWNKPRPVPGTPDLEIQNGEHQIAGTGSCAYSMWIFKNSGLEYLLQEPGCSSSSDSLPAGSRGTLSVSKNGKSILESQCY